MKTGWWKNLYVQVIAAIFAGVLVGYFSPETEPAIKPLGA